MKATLPNLQILDVSLSNLSSEHLPVLVNGSWPEMQDLSLGYNQLNHAALSAVVQGSWPLIRVIDLGNCELDTPAMKVYITGNWPLLQKASFRNELLRHRELVIARLGSADYCGDQSCLNDTTRLSAVQAQTYGGYRLLEGHTSFLQFSHIFTLCPC